MQNKVVVITGSTSGIGLGIAKEFAKAKYNIVFNGLEPNGAEIAENVGKEFGIKTLFFLFQYYRYFIKFRVQYHSMKN